MRRRLLLVVVSVGLSVAVLEAALRVIGYAPGEFHLFRENPAGTGSYRLRPNVDVTIPFAGRAIHVTTNSHGMRWPEVTVARPDHRAPRVAFVGDSFTFGQWADTLEASFVGQVSSRLASSRVEVLNFGTPGYGFADIELIIREQVLQFSPDAIVVASYTGNDFLDTYLGIDRFRISETGALVVDQDLLDARVPAAFRPPVSGRAWLQEHVYLARVASRARARFFPPPPAAAPDPAAPPPHPSTSSELFWSQATYPPFAEEARDVSLAALGRIADLCARSGVRLLITTIPTRAQVALSRNPAAGFDATRPQQFIASFAAERGVPFLDLLPGLAQRAAGTELYYPHDGHLNTAGHAAAGELLAPFVAAAVAEPPL